MVVYYAEADVQKVGNVLAVLGQQKKPPTVQSFLKEHRPLIRKIIKRGFGYERIAEVFQEAGISVEAMAIADVCMPKKKDAKQSGHGKGTKPASYPALQQVLTNEHVSMLSQTLEVLSQTKNGLTYQEVIECHLAAIEAALGNGWSAQDIIDKFAEGGLKLQCKESTFLQGIKQARRQRKKVPEHQDEKRKAISHTSVSTQASMDSGGWNRLSVPDQSQQTAIEKEFNT